MKITLHELRRIIREQVGTIVFIRNAGFGGEGGVSSLKKYKDLPPSGLGDEGEEEQEKHGEEQEKPQWTVRVRDREPRS